MFRRMDDEGQLSVDFLIGFTIFMLGLIMVASMVPGLMVGLRRTTAIDYDAVAYRTGAILAEDPGWPVYPAWEKANNREAVDRFGLAVDKETPNVLSKIKIRKFFGKDLGMTYPNDYRSRLIFGDYPYRLNVTLNATVDSGYEVYSIGDQKPKLELEGYGYIRRVVKIKDEPWITIDLNATHLDHYCLDNTTVREEQNFTVRLDFRELLKRNISPAYQYNPLVEPINITIFNFYTKFNNTGNDTIGWFNNRSCNASIPEQWNGTPPDNATLKSVRFRIAGMLGEFDPDDFGWSYNFTVSNVSYTCTPNVRINNTSEINFIIYPAELGDLIHESTVLDIVFTFGEDPPEPPHMLIDGIYAINYTTREELYIPELRNGWLEVAIW